MCAVAVVSIFLGLVKSVHFPLRSPLITTLVNKTLVKITVKFVVGNRKALTNSAVLTEVIGGFFNVGANSTVLYFSLVITVPSTIVVNFRGVLLAVIRLCLSTIVLGGLLTRFIRGHSLAVVSRHFRRLTSTLSSTAGRNIAVVSNRKCIDKRGGRLLCYIYSAGSLIGLVGLVARLSPGTFIIVRRIEDACNGSLLEVLWLAGGLRFMMFVALFIRNGVGLGG